MTADHEGPAGLDALMAALTDDPLPDEARADAAFRAEHRAAQADLAVLREQLGIIGNALGEPPPAVKPVPVRPARPARPVRPARTRRRARDLAFGTLAVAAVAAVLSGMAWLLTQAGGGVGAASDSAGDSAASKQVSGARFGSPRYLACARTVAEGTVTRLEQLPDDEQLLVTVRVTRSYKPAKSRDELTYAVGRYDVPDLAKGDQVLLGVPEDTTTPDHWVVGEQEVARERAGIIASLPESRTITCG
ncbi:hypothetical protein [Streptomyces cellulosae]|uniref:hypothetical protein n=1 Tax=Streptomyces cellulosae TaxID=1968 RepID=UPI0004C640D8|nr:hypothetical protein [Streptomyces cellulosae]